MIQHIYLGCGPTREATSQKTSTYVRTFYVFHYEGIPLRVGECRVSTEKHFKPGQLVVEDSKLLLGTGERALQILQLQKPGGKMLAVSDFLRGFPIKQPCQIAFASSSSLVSEKFH